MTNIPSRNAMEWIHVPPIGDTPMTGAERQARYRASRADGAPAEALQTIVELDLSELQTIEPPRDSAVIDEPDSPTSKGDEDARWGDRSQPINA
jgi:hypothetical protein